MTDTPGQPSHFTFESLEYKLRERLEEALEHVNTLPKEEVLQCSDDYLQNLIDRFMIPTLRLRSEETTLDEEVPELSDYTFYRKTGDTGHQILIPFDGDPEWLTQIGSQRAPQDGYPIAFLDQDRHQIYIKCRLAPTDTDDMMKHNVDYRTSLVEEYVRAVSERLANFNSELEVEVAKVLGLRKEAILKAKRARNLLGLPEVNNPRNREIRKRMERLGQELMKRVSGGSTNNRVIDKPALDIAHVLFMDVVGYSKLPVDKQTSTLQLLQDTVQQTRDFALALEQERLIAIPTGDGMALGFFGDLLASVKCAMEVSRRLRNSSDISLRIGLNSGPVYVIKDINNQDNLAGDGINVAQRVMDLGDAGHILLSKRVADDLSVVSGWSQNLSDLGEVEVKHGKLIHIFNLAGTDFGNRDCPTKMK
jgi:class 3 adenylate cyclase